MKVWEVQYGKKGIGVERYGSVWRVTLSLGLSSPRSFV